MSHRDPRNDPKKKGTAPGSFNAPFKGLKLKPPESAPPPSSATPAKPRPLSPRHASSTEGLSDEEVFQIAMSGTRRIVDPRGMAPPPAPRPPPKIVDDEAEALAHLAELVSGQATLDISDTDEFIEGCAPGVNGQLMLALKRGDYALQGHLDLHGMTRPQAKEAVGRFLLASRREGKRCVLLIHGRGLNSEDQIPVLKEQLNVWLRHSALAQSVLAFCTARPHDGGAGALYLLLRR